MEVTKETLDHIFKYHAPNPEQVTRYLLVRVNAKLFAARVLDECPPSAERTLALRKIQEAVMWANSAIALMPESLPQHPATPEAPATSSADTPSKAPPSPAALSEAPTPRGRLPGELA